MDGDDIELWAVEIEWDALKLDTQRESSQVVDAWEKVRHDDNIEKKNYEEMNTWIST